MTDSEEASGGSEDLRDAIEERYDLEEFGPREMQEMSVDEWETLFDAETWITGSELLDRVESDLRARVELRDIFAVIEREGSSDDDRIVAYSDEGYAIVWQDGTVEGQGTVLRDVEPVVALCSMEDYDPDAPTGDGSLPDPSSIESDGTELGNTVMQVVGIVQILAGVALLGGWIIYRLTVFVPIVAIAFIIFGIFILILVANARLSDRFRAAQYRDRLEAAQAGTEKRPPFVPETASRPPVTEAENGDGERDE